MGKDRNLKPLRRGLAIVALAMGAGVGMGGSCEPKPSAPPDGWGPIELKPETGFTEDTVVYVDTVSIDSLQTGCIILKAIFGDGHGGDIVTFDLARRSKYGPDYDPVFSTDCDPTNETNSSIADAQGTAFIKATWLTLGAGDRPNHFYHPGDSFGFKATANTAEAFSPMLVFWKRITFEVDCYYTASWLDNPWIPDYPWNPNVTRNFFFAKNARGQDVQTLTDTACYEILYDPQNDINDDIGWSEYFSVLDSNWWPIPKWDRENTGPVDTCIRRLIGGLLPGLPGHRYNGGEADTANNSCAEGRYQVYLVFADSSKDCVHPTDPALNLCGLTRYFTTGGNYYEIVFVFTKAIKKYYNPATPATFDTLCSMIVAYELLHYLCGMGIYDHDRHCLMDNDFDNPLNSLINDKTRWRECYICPLCIDSIKSYKSVAHPGEIVPFGFGSHKNQKEMVK